MKGTSRAALLRIGRHASTTCLDLYTSACDVLTVLERTETFDLSRMPLQCMQSNFYMSLVLSVDSGTRPVPFAMQQQAGIHYTYVLNCVKC